MFIERFNGILPEISAINRLVEGCLTEREAEFLALIAAFPTAEGIILEIGSFKGRSTIILCRAKSINDNAPLVSVDPLTSPSTTDPELDKTGQSQSFKTNIRKFEVEGLVEFHEKYSHEVAEEWKRPIRFLWIDGDHTYKGVKQDFDNFSPFLTDCSIVALHDILIGYDGPIRVFMEDILLSPNFHAAGMCGSIGWAQYRKKVKSTKSQDKYKAKLYRRLASLIPLFIYKESYSGKISDLRYNMLRAMVPHKTVNPAEWIEQVDSALER